MSSLETMFIKFAVKAPPRKLGIHLHDKNGVNGASVSSVGADSTLAGKVLRGDHIVSINGIDVSGMNCEGKSHSTRPTITLHYSITLILLLGITFQNGF